MTFEYRLVTSKNFDMKWQITYGLNSSQEKKKNIGVESLRDTRF